MKKNFIIGLLITLFFFFSCGKKEIYPLKIRDFVDTIGFAHTAWQTDSILKRIDRIYGSKIDSIRKKHALEQNKSWLVVISPHDDHAYASYLYPLLFQNVKAKHLIIFGVAHKARFFNLKDSLVFGTYDYWKGAYGNIKISDFRDKIIKLLPQQDFVINDSMIAVEHSIEAFLPFIQKFDNQADIIPILVPYMDFQRMNQIAQDLAEVIYKIAEKNDWVWGKDFAIIISNDAVHYGDEDWGGSDLAPFGADKQGYKKALEYEKKVIQTITDTISPEKIRKFVSLTVQDTDYTKYKWTWCGRYSVPMGLLTSYYLAKKFQKNLKGTLLDYATSIDHKPLPILDLNMGVTAPANIHHWVGYVDIGYEFTK